MPSRIGDHSFVGYSGPCAYVAMRVLLKARNKAVFREETYDLALIKIFVTARKTHGVCTLPTAKRWVHRLKTRANP